MKGLEAAAVILGLILLGGLVRMGYVAFIGATDRWIQEEKDKLPHNQQGLK